MMLLTSLTKRVITEQVRFFITSNGYGIPVENVNAEVQKIYYKALSDWSISESILTFVFEAFDEPWKRFELLNEPEKTLGRTSSWMKQQNLLLHNQSATNRPTFFKISLNCIIWCSFYHEC